MSKDIVSIESDFIRVNMLEVSEGRAGLAKVTLFR
ncbi:hypothetical protein M2408_002726 [Sphingobacterium sp. BIGb0165]|nr:hypothetical protein [Sphingobacterium sp. BIGb0165]